jgi:hypothetical protein
MAVRESKLLGRVGPCLEHSSPNRYLTVSFAAVSEGWLLVLRQRQARIASEFDGSAQIEARRDGRVVDGGLSGTTLSVGDHCSWLAALTGRSKSSLGPEPRMHLLSGDQSVVSC